MSLSVLLRLLSKSRPFFLEHLGLYPHPFRNDSPPLRRDFPLGQLAYTQRIERLALYKIVFTPVSPTESEGLLDSHGRVGNNAQGAGEIWGARMHHERVKEDHIAYLARHLCEVLTVIDLLEVRKVARVV